MNCLRYWARYVRKREVKSGGDEKEREQKWKRDSERFEMRKRGSKFSKKEEEEREHREFVEME